MLTLIGFGARVFSSKYIRGKTGQGKNLFSILVSFYFFSSNERVCRSIRKHWKNLKFV